MSNFWIKILDWLGERNLYLNICIGLGSVVILIMAIELMFLPNASDATSTTLSFIRSGFIALLLVVTTLSHIYNRLENRRKIDRLTQEREKLEKKLDGHPNNPFTVDYEPSSYQVIDTRSKKSLND